MHIIIISFSLLYGLLLVPLLYDKKNRNVKFIFSYIFMCGGVLFLLTWIGSCDFFTDFARYTSDAMFTLTPP